jgi:hypothetical protein
MATLEQIINKLQHMDHVHAVNEILKLGVGFSDIRNNMDLIRTNLFNVMNNDAFRHIQYGNESLYDRI